MGTGLNRIGTFIGDTAFVVKFGNKQLELKKAQLPLLNLNTAEKVESALLLAHGESLPVPIFAHFNRDGSVALASGKRPSIWPEDEVFSGRSL